MSNTKTNSNGLSLKNRIAYAGTDAAGNLLYCTLTSFINFYHTDVFGLSIGTAAIIALFVQAGPWQGALRPAALPCRAGQPGQRAWPPLR